MLDDSKTIRMTNLTQSLKEGKWNIEYWPGYGFTANNRTTTNGSLSFLLRCVHTPENQAAVMQFAREVAKTDSDAARQVARIDATNAAHLIAALEEARSAINSMKVEAETAAQGDEQMMLEACETISNEGLQADMAIRAALASAPKPSPAPQADSQPAPVRDYPPLPDFDTVEQHIYGACRRYITQDMLEPIHNLIRYVIDADRAARAPADSVTAPAGGANWQDISTAPKDGTLFVAVGNNYGLDSETQHTCIAQWFRGCWMEVSEWNEDSELKYLTHWMPLPPLPGSAARKKGGA